MSSCVTLFDCNSKYPSKEITIKTMSAEKTALLCDAPTEIGVSKKRWLVLATFFFYGMSNQIQYTTFTTIVRQVQSFYGVNATEVNMLAAIFPIVYVILVFPGCKLYDSMGIRGGMILGTTVNFVGALIKAVTALWYPHYWLLCIGQMSCAVGQVLFLSLPPLIASTWFPDSERTLATAIGTLAGYVGMATGMFYAPRIVTPDNSGSEAFSILFGTQFFLTLGVWLTTLVFVEGAPPMSPSLTAVQHGGMEVLPSLKRIVANKHLMILTTAFGCVLGLFTALATVMAEFLEPMGVSEAQTGVIAFVGILLGSANCGVVGPIVDKTRKYKKPLVLIFSLLVVMCALIMVLMKTVSAARFLPVAYVMVIIIEIILLPAVPVTMELAVEMAYPDPPSIASSAVIASLSLWSVVATIIFSAMLGNHPSVDNSFMLIGITGGGVGLSLLALAFVKEKLHRADAEQSLSNPSSPAQLQS